MLFFFMSLNCTHCKLHFIWKLCEIHLRPLVRQLINNSELNSDTEIRLCSSKQKLIVADSSWLKSKTYLTTYNAHFWANKDINWIWPDRRQRLSRSHRECNKGIPISKMCSQGDQIGFRKSHASFGYLCWHSERKWDSEYMNQRVFISIYDCKLDE